MGAEFLIGGANPIYVIGVELWQDILGGMTSLEGLGPSLRVITPTWRCGDE